MKKNNIENGKWLLIVGLLYVSTGIFLLLDEHDAQQKIAVFDQQPIPCNLAKLGETCIFADNEQVPNDKYKMVEGDDRGKEISYDKIPYPENSCLSNRNMHLTCIETANWLFSEATITVKTETESVTVKIPKLRYTALNGYEWRQEQVALPFAIDPDENFVMTVRTKSGQKLVWTMPSIPFRVSSYSHIRLLSGAHGKYFIPYFRTYGDDEIPADSAKTMFSKQHSEDNLPNNQQTREADKIRNHDKQLKWQGLEFTEDWTRIGAATIIVKSNNLSTAKKMEYSDNQAYAFIPGNFKEGFKVTIIRLDGANWEFDVPKEYAELIDAQIMIGSPSWDKDKPWIQLNFHKNKTVRNGNGLLLGGAFINAK